MQQLLIVVPETHCIHIALNGLDTMGSKRKHGGNQGAQSGQPPQKRAKQLKSESSNGSSKPSSGKGAKLDKSPFTERPTVEERKREAHLYELLGSEDTNDRITAADAIVSGLLPEEGVPEAVLQRHLANRLFRGLASGRNASRLGFSLVLTELLSQLFGKKDLASKHPNITFEKVLDTLVEKTQPSGSIPGQEERDHYFGQLFGIECFVRAGILFKEKARWLAVLDLLLKLSEKKVWLRPQCGWIIVQAVRQMKPKLASTTLQTLADRGHGQTPEGAAIWIAAMDCFGDELKLPAKPWTDPLSLRSLPDLTLSLRDSGRDTSNDREQTKGKPKQNNWTPQLHFVWDVLLDHFKSQPQNSASVTNFSNFWNKVVDESFFSKNASENQKFSGFMIFQKMLDEGAACPFIVDNIFSKNLMVCLMNQASKEDRYLHRAALKALKSIEATAQKEPSIIVPVLKHLLGKNGGYNFDQRTNTKTIDKVLQFVQPSDAEAVLKVLKELNNLEPPQSIQIYANYLLKLASLPSESGVSGVALQKLAKLTYTKHESDEDGKIQGMLQTRLTSAFARFVKRRQDFAQFCNAVLMIEADVGIDEEIQTEYVHALERLRDLLDTTDVDEELQGPYQGLALLHAVGLLQLYNEDPDALDTLADLEQCYDKLKNREEEDEEGISAFLVEILLSMVARPSSLMRQVSQQVFEAFTPIMSEQAVKLLTDPLLAEESEKGQQALFSTEDEDLAGEGEDDDDDHSHDEDDLDSDVEIVDLEEAGSDMEMGGDDEPEEDDSDSDEEKDEKEEEEGDQDLEELDKALAQVLGSHRLDKDAEAESEEDDSDMSDSEMMELDSKLVEIFKQRVKGANKKKDKKDAKESVVNFKHRVLDLLAIFIKMEAAENNPLAFQALLPLLQLIRTTTTKALANKACGIVLEFSKSLKKAPKKTKETTPKAEIDELLALLNEIHEEAGKDISHSFAKAASSASLSVASVLIALEQTQNVFLRYMDTQQKWYQGEIRIQPSFFSDWINWCQSHASKPSVKQGEKEDKDEVDEE
ncbi:DNA-directed DNA polymerase [Coniochaeta pulveracea]|uniref:DNA-directed DNA polymerase n=1 Tax=Coniochaeta pulveracea TaxID=177199 RepID=A0A420XYK5_9PEZI|nr:DNA-directed DNA polymerase [Coniochaeta pulveracea]